MNNEVILEAVQEIAEELVKWDFDDKETVKRCLIEILDFMAVVHMRQKGKLKEELREGHNDRDDEEFPEMICEIRKGWLK